MEEIKNTFLRDLSLLKESEDHIEFKEAKRNFNWDGGDHKDPKERRHCILGYVAALANERGGRLVFGMKDKQPHEVVGTSFEEGNLGALEDAIYDKMQIRVPIKEEFEPSKVDPKRKRVIIFNVPSPPLCFDTIQVMKADHYGFNIIRQDNTDIVSDVVLHGDTVAITCKESPVGCRIRYGVNGEFRKGGRLHGPRGNLRDSQGEKRKVTINGKTYPQDNWCYIFDYPCVAEP